MIQPAQVSRDNGLATVIDKMQEAGTTIAFVSDGEEMVGTITLSDTLKRLFDVKVQEDLYSQRIELVGLGSNWIAIVRF